MFGRHGIVLPGQAEPRQIMLNRNSVKLNSTFLRIQEEPPPSSGGSLFVRQSSKSYGYFSKRQETSLIFCAKTLPVRSSQAAEPEARRSRRNWKRYTPLRHVPERILPYTLCLRWFLCNRRYNKQSNQLNAGLFGDISPCLVLLLCRLPCLPACLSSLRAAAVPSSI